MDAGSGKIIIVLVVFLFLSSVAGVVIWGAATNWWSPEEETKSSGSSGASRPSGAPAPTTVTINGQTFDPSGYTVSKGLLWNSLPAAPTAATSSAADCRQRCVDTSECTSFARAENTTPVATAGSCFVNKFNTDNSARLTHVRGVKTDGSNLYSKPNFISWYYDSANDKYTMDIGECISNCTSNSSCVAWYYRTSEDSDANLRRTCVLHKDDQAFPNKYREGFIDR